MKLRLIKIIAIVFFLFSCDNAEEKKTPPSPQPELPVVQEPELKLEKVPFSTLKNWSKDDFVPAMDAFKKSCSKILAIKKESLGNSEIKIPTKSYQDICKLLPHIKQQDYQKFLESHFHPYAVTYKNSPTGKFTSYYEAELKASYNKSDKYKYPIYGRPNDMIEINLQDFDKTLPNRRFVGRIKDKKLIPYFTRDEISKNPIDAPVILWSDSDIDIYVMQIQGSAVAHLEDGSFVRIGYAETNGREFKGIGSILLEKGLLQPGEVTMGNIKRWLKNNLKLAQAPLNENQRYVFHRLITAEGPLGAQGVPLTAGRSLAVDKSYVPLGALLWLETTGPHREKIDKLVVAQDIGGAIKGAIRGDYFWGSGNDDILELAGRMHSNGQYYILIPQSVEVKP